MIRPNTFARITGTTERDELEAAIREFGDTRVITEVREQFRKNDLSILTDAALAEMYDALRQDALLAERVKAANRILRQSGWM